METDLGWTSMTRSDPLKPSLVEWKLPKPDIQLPQPRALKPSLVEWKPSCRSLLILPAEDLETFLGGMETTSANSRDSRCSALKPSLVEWKQGKREPEPRVEVPSLKPSLVEWKQLGTFFFLLREHLETFLGGMETRPASPAPARSPSLETFLGGMETHRPDVSVRIAQGFLETFLGGMETWLSVRRPRRASLLETFLGGMETGKVWGLVEGLWALETFLGGMETAQ